MIVPKQYQMIQFQNLSMQQTGTPGILNDIDDYKIETFLYLPNNCSPPAGAGIK